MEGDDNVKTLTCALCCRERSVKRVLYWFFTTLQRCIDRSHPPPADQHQLRLFRARLESKYSVHTLYDDDDGWINRPYCNIMLCMRRRCIKI